MVLNAAHTQPKCTALCLRQSSGSPRWRPRSRHSVADSSVSKVMTRYGLEVWTMLEEDAFEWSAQYNDYLVHYYDSTEEDPETRTSVWQWLDSAMELVVGDSHESAEDEEEPAAASTGPSAGQGKRRRR